MGIIGWKYCCNIFQRKSLPSNNFLATLGFLAILFSIFAFNRSTAFPSLYTLVPVLGTMAVIVFCKWYDFGRTTS